MFIMDNSIAKIGDVVIYTGDTSHVCKGDAITKCLMSKRLEPGASYIVENYTDYMKSGNIHYNICGIWYPNKSFVKRYREYTELKYGFK